MQKTKTSPLLALPLHPNRDESSTAGEGVDESSAAAAAKKTRIEAEEQQPEVQAAAAEAARDKKGPKPFEALAGVNGGDPYDVLVWGMEGSGKTTMLRDFLGAFGNHEEGLKELQRAKKEDTPPVVFPVSFFGKKLRILKCSGKEQCYALIRDQLGRTKWLFLVYKPTMEAQEVFSFLEKAIRDGLSAGCRILLIANLWNVLRGAERKVDRLELQDLALKRSMCYVVETTFFFDALSMVAPTFPMQTCRPLTHRPPPGFGFPTENGVREDPRTPPIATGSLGESRRGGDIGRKVETEEEVMPQLMLLRPSLKGTESMGRQAGEKPREEGGWNDVRCVQKVTESESAVTCVCFGQERQHFHYYLLAAAAKDGNVVIYRIYRTEMERAQMSKDLLDKIQSVTSGQRSQFDAALASEHSMVATHTRLVGHSGEASSMCFSPLEDQVVTASIDKTVRVWDSETGEMKKVFTDSLPCLVAAFLPFNPNIFVATNTNAVLRLMNLHNGTVHQKLKVETAVRALTFDDTGRYGMAGTKAGHIHILEASGDKNLKFKFRLQVATAPITCMTFVPSKDPQRHPMLLVSHCDSLVSIVDFYGQAAGMLSCMLQRRVKVEHSLLPLRCCYSDHGGGFLISGSEDKEVYVYALAKGAQYKAATLEHHRAPVLAVATNALDSLLVSADSMGSIAMWRRYDFSHLNQK
uniref:Uncharacterized protein n=1 Tax=Chromera velia CCMP2878 TaxID=1169474 RepID=A0A0G4I0A2_9ALVE|eukprot:Cvel_9897.t1-p1 / transcript=Cvel_9897.t1 / gene=Cvel_9897 / organism=Chromera_velia_CCMP2878 / gene_product=WD repeat-containing protein 13, putative / transcript_product=WD repeat-containing protein 13, putative / location=Cvel_scaffold584:23573-28155(-) / protein_length=693 / sequence_SO=supercontig / SO=protein_coding / is_pseudo=false